MRYAEVDPQQIVFNSRYLEYADLIITEYWRTAGIGGTGGQPFECNVRHATIDYIRPIRVDELVDGHARVTRFGTSSMTTEIRLCGADAPDDLRATITLIHVHVDLAAVRPLPIPLDIRMAFERLDGLPG